PCVIECVGDDGCEGHRSEGEGDVAPAAQEHELLPSCCSLSPDAERVQQRQAPRDEGDLRRDGERGRQRWARFLAMPAEEIAPPARGRNEREGGQERRSGYGERREGAERRVHRAPRRELGGDETREPSGIAKRLDRALLTVLPGGLLEMIARFRDHAL